MSFSGNHILVCLLTWLYDFQSQLHFLLCLACGDKEFISRTILLPKLNIPSAINTDCILWHTQLIMYSLPILNLKMDSFLTFMLIHVQCNAQKAYNLKFVLPMKTWKNNILKSKTITEIFSTTLITQSAPRQKQTKFCWGFFYSTWDI